MNLNKALILGRVTADPQLRTTTSGAAVTSFGIATNRLWKDKNGARQEDTEFHNIVAWGRQAEVATQYLKKGAIVLVEGRLQTRTWADKQNQNHRTTEIICERLQLGPRAAGSTSSPQAGSTPFTSSGQAAAQGEKQDMHVPAQIPPPEEIPTVDIEDDVKMDDLPF